MPQINVRKSVAVLTVSAACMFGIYGREGFEPVARNPLPNDVPTFGYGTTEHDDGTPVKTGEAITEPEARKLAEGQVRNKYEAGVRKCTTDLKLYQREWDFLVDSAYNIGIAGVCRSGMVREFRAGNYDAGCNYILNYKYVPGPHGTKIDCTIKSNKCVGIPKDRERARRMCMGI